MGAPVASRGGVRRGAWTQLPPGVRPLPCSSRLQSWLGAGLSCAPGGLLAAPPVISLAGLHGSRVRTPPRPNACGCPVPTRCCGVAPGLLNPNPVQRDQVPLRPSYVPSLPPWVCSLGPRHGSGRRLAYSSESWVPECVWRVGGRFVLASRLSLAICFHNLRGKLKQAGVGAAGPCCLWGAPQGVDPQKVLPTRPCSRSAPTPLMCCREPGCHGCPVDVLTQDLGKKAMSWTRGMWPQEEVGSGEGRTPGAPAQSQLIQRHCAAKGKPALPTASPDTSQDPHPHPRGSSGSGCPLVTSGL